MTQRKANFPVLLRFLAVLALGLTASLPAAAGGRSQLFIGFGTTFGAPAHGYGYHRPYGFHRPHGFYRPYGFYRGHRYYGHRHFYRPWAFYSFSLLAPLYYDPPARYIPPPAYAPPGAVPPPARGAECQRFQGDAIIDASGRPFYGTACLWPDGRWHILD